MSIILESPQQLKMRISRHAKERRLKLNLSRKSLSSKSGVPESTIKRFETSGDMSLGALLQIALVLDSLQQFSELFKQHTPVTLFKLQKARKRGRG